MGWYSYNRYPKKETVSQRQAKAAKAIKKLSAKRIMDPVQVDGPLAVSWWAKAWNRNLEGYADYSNRLPRGRSYAKNGSVINLAIASGSISALVQGSASKPYEIEIEISPMKPAARQTLIEACADKLDSAEALLSGHFPEDLGRLLTESKTGLFPNPKEIKFSCSCPDWATLCKHVAATLYGVGSRLDRDSAIFFLLRDVKLEDLVSHAVKSETQKMLKAKGSGGAARLKLGASDLGALFGVELAKENEFDIEKENLSETPKPKPKPKPKAKAKAKAMSKSKSKPKAKPKAKPKPALKSIVKKGVKKTAKKNV